MISTRQTSQRRHLEQRICLAIFDGGKQRKYVTFRLFLDVIVLNSFFLLLRFIQTIGRFSTPQTPWRWDDQNNCLVHDRDVTAEKADINAEAASEKIDLWNLPPGKRPFAYERYPLEMSKNKKIVSIDDIVRKFNQKILALT